MKRLTYVLLCFAISIGMAVAQNTRVTGTVLSADDGEPVIGASVMVKGTAIGTITNIDGRFELNVPSSSRTLVISYVGMVTQEAAVQASVRVVLQSDTQNLDEVIVVAYGTTKKSSFTGAATAVGSQLIEKRALTNVASALEGNVSGLQVTSGYGQPGSSPSFRIRGFGSINSSSSPLIVLDGAIFDGEMADLNPNDIESMTVLKDAASTSLYGSSAGNGVILITTKQAKGDGTHNVSLNITQGFSQRGVPEYDRVSVWDYYPVQWEMLRNTYQYNSKQDAATAAENASKNIYTQLKYNPFKGIANDAIVGTDGKLNPNANTLLWGDDLDWTKESYRTGHYQDYNLSYSSKTDKSDAFASVSYQDNQGYAVKTDLERFTGRVNYNIYPVKWFKTGLNIAASRSQSNKASSDNDSSNSYNNIFRFTRGMAPIYPVYKHDPETGAYLLGGDGERLYDTDGSRLSDAGRHAIAETLWNERLSNRDQLSARTYLEFSLYEGLKLNINANIENRNLRSKTYENTKVGDGAPAGRMNITQNRYTIYQFNQLLTYAKSFGLHNTDFLAGHENYSYERQYMYGMRQGEVLSGLHEFGNFVTINTLSSYTDTYTKEGYLFRGNYNYDDRYYGSFSYRRDGTSRFFTDSRWGNFWSFGLSWRIDQENFLKEINWINSLKLRASYGETGNDDLGTYYAYQTVYNNGLNNKDEAGIFFDKFGNKDLKWETSVSSDVAVEFGLFDRLTGSMEYYNKQSRDLLFDVPTPTSAGITSISKNIGKIANYGLEVNLNYLVLKNKDWKVSVGANVSTIKNEIKSLPEETPTIVSGTKQYKVGHSRYDYWLRQYVGVDPATGSALYTFDAENQSKGNDVFEKDGQEVTTTLSKAKYDYSESSIPKLYGGFNASVQYRSFELSGVFSYQLGGKLLDEGYKSLMENRYGYAQHTDVFKAWKQEGDITDIPRRDQSKTADFDGTSSRWLISSDYLNIKSITLTYTLPKSVLRPIGFKATRVSLSGENLYQLNARKGLNSMAEFSGTVYNAYLPARTVTAGLNVTF
ncbi:Outer membrane cobalamin receptor protein, SusC/RagA family [Bacteroidales bacterium Barb6XT]|nr:Outer membrane cobalamin receptor protein, SusC/RagA family [Bacteroidales bacterium Barb6XT]